MRKKSKQTVIPPPPHRTIEQIKADIPGIRTVNTNTELPITRIVSEKNIEPDPIPIVEDEQKERKARKPRNNPSFPKEDWRLEQNDEFYMLYQKYYKGPKFKEMIKLTKKYWIIKNEENEYIPEKRKEGE